MERTILVLNAILCTIHLVSGTVCINNCLCEVGRCSACSVTGYSETIRCKKCPPGCLSCQGQNLDICIRCTRQYALKNGSCYHCPTGCELCQYVGQWQVCKICGRGYYWNWGLCTLCLSHCQNCRSINDCNDCNEFCISCAPNCVACTSYNNCQGCRAGYFGESCNQRCSQGCIDSICNKQDGHCSCKEAWHGLFCDQVCPESCKGCQSDTFCNECKTGYYGKICEHRCSVGCLDDVCGKNTSECMACKTNYVGVNCDPCPERHFGDNCKENCPANCHLCSSNTNCSTCRSSFFGEMCEKRCSDRCAEILCEKNTGKCLQCKANFTGVLCEKCLDDFEGDNCQECVSGRYGSRCENNCQANCKQCTANISWQMCKSGYRGDLCSEKYSDGQRDDVEKIGLISGASLFAAITALLLVYVLLLRRRLAHKDSVSDNTHTRTDNIGTNRSDLEMVTIPPRMEGTIISDPNQQSAVCKLLMNTTASGMENGENVSADISAHVYSNPYERPLEFSEVYTNTGLHAYDAPTS